MKKRKGFTLIELLAVIVVLAVIALITTPTILSVIERTKKSSLVASSRGYLEAIENQLFLNKMESEEIKDGTYQVENGQIKKIGEKYKGKGPNQGIIKIEEEKIKEAKLCFEKYSIHYDGKESKMVEDNYCSNNFEITLEVSGNKYSKKIGKEESTTIDISDINTSNITNISCNNGVYVNVENNILELTDIYGDTTCKMNNSLEESINGLDNSKNMIVMMNQEIISSTLIIQKNKNIVFDLNGKMITHTVTKDRPLFENYGVFEINDFNGSGSIKSNYRLFSNYNNLIINNGIFIRENKETNEGAVIGTGKNGVTIINDGVYQADMTWSVFSSGSNSLTIINGGTISSNENAAVVGHDFGKVIIHGGTIYSMNHSAVAVPQTGGYVDITGGYIYTDAPKTQVVSAIMVRNNEKSVVNIYGDKAVLDSNYNYISGVYIDGKDRSAIVSYGGTVNIMGGTFTSAYRTVNALGTSVVNISGNSDIIGTTLIAAVISQESSKINIQDANISGVLGNGIVNIGTGSIYICGGKVSGNPSFADLYIENGTGYIYYNSFVQLQNNKINDNTNNPSHIVLDNTIVCK